MEKHLARYAQWHSRLRFVHPFCALGEEEVRHWRPFPITGAVADRGRPQVITTPVVALAGVGLLLGAA